MYARSDAYYIVRNTNHGREVLPVSYDRLEAATVDMERMQRESTDPDARYNVESNAPTVVVRVADLCSGCADRHARVLCVDGEPTSTVITDTHVYGATLLDPEYNQPRAARPAFACISLSIGE